MPIFGAKVPRFRDGGGGGHYVQKNRRADQQDATTEGPPTVESNNEEIGELMMPQETENRLVNLFARWTTKFSALNAEIDQVLTEARASGEQIDKNIEQRKRGGT
jgi:hypothetical protein